MIIFVCWRCSIWLFLFVRNVHDHFSFLFLFVWRSTWSLRMHRHLHDRFGFVEFNNDHFRIITCTKLVSISTKKKNEKENYLFTWEWGHSYLCVPFHWSLLDHVDSYAPGNDWQGRKDFSVQLYKKYITMMWFQLMCVVIRQCFRRRFQTSKPKIFILMQCVSF